MKHKRVHKRLRTSVVNVRLLLNLRLEDLTMILHASNILGCRLELFDWGVGVLVTKDLG